MKLSNLIVLGLIMSVGYAGDTTKPALDIPLEIKKVDNKFFINIAGGGSFLNVDNELGLNTTFSNGALDDKGVVGEVALGYRYSENIFTEFALQRTMLDIADIDNIYVSANYQYSDVFAKPYIGAVIGYSKLTWSDDPAAVVLNKDLTSEGVTYGVQAGLQHSFNENWGISGKYQFLKYDHATDIRDGDSSIEHTYGQNILMGVNYEF